MTPREQAEDFLKNQTQFHLGFLPTEQSSPLTRTLEKDFLGSSEKGIRTLQKPDWNVVEMAVKCFAGTAFQKLDQAMFQTIVSGGRVVFSGCGATGRLSILLESMWRTSCRKLLKQHPQLQSYRNSVLSLMTGGDYALIKSVESFEDYQIFGRRQVRDLHLTPDDMLVAITEGGETSSVLGTAQEAADLGLKVFLLFNNPASLLVEKLERSRKAIQDPRITVLDLFCGPMALAGSTRMQATTSEQLIAGAALERALCRILHMDLPDHAALFTELVHALGKEENIQSIAQYLDFESDTFRNGGKITYYTHEFLIDVFTDTTERSPTFMLPPFKASGDRNAPEPWAMVKDPLLKTAQAWDWALDRPPRCLNWTMRDYLEMNAGINPEKIPHIQEKDFLQFEIGCEPCPERTQNSRDCAVAVLIGDETGNQELLHALQAQTRPFPNVRTWTILAEGGDFSVSRLPRSKENEPLRLMDHLAVKLILNTVSTGGMARLGRISGNWMSWVSLSNKKLIDRGIRLLSELGNIPYPDACLLLMETREECLQNATPGQDPRCAVQEALKKINSAKI